MQAYVNERFVAVKVNDTREDPAAKKLGVSQEGYPNIVVYDASGERIGRVIGFGGKDPWFKEVKQAVALGERLAEAKAKAEKDAAAWVGVADLLKTVAGREKDALEALGKVPEKAQKSKEYQAAKASLEARVGWNDVQAALQEALKGVASREDAAAKAPGLLEKVEEFLKQHAGADKEIEAAALAKKGFYLMLQDKEKEAAEVARRLLADFADTPAAKALLRGLR